MEHGRERVDGCPQTWPNHRKEGKITSGERGKTILCSMNAHGRHIPPFMIFPRKKMNDHLLLGSPPGTVGVTDSGWPDSGWPDSGWTDSGWTDSGWTDSGWTDSGWTDSTVLR